MSLLHLPQITVSYLSKIIQLEIRLSVAIKIVFICRDLVVVHRGILVDPILALRSQIIRRMGSIDIRGVLMKRMMKLMKNSKMRKRGGKLQKRNKMKMKNLILRQRARTIRRCRITLILACLMMAPNFKQRILISHHMKTIIQLGIITCHSRIPNSQEKMSFYQM